MWFITNLCVAVMMVENPSNIPANLKHRAYGPLQIRQAALDDVNKYAKTSYQLKDFVTNLTLSIWAFNQYGLRYKCDTPAAFVRNWHRGTSEAELEEYTDRIMRLYAEARKERTQ